MPYSSNTTWSNGNSFEAAEKLWNTEPMWSKWLSPVQPGAVT